MRETICHCRRRSGAQRHIFQQNRSPGACRGAWPTVFLPFYLPDQIKENHAVLVFIFDSELTLDARYHYLQTRPCLSGWRFSYEKLSQDHHKVRVAKLRLKRFLPGASGERVLLAPGVEPCALKVSRFPKPARVAPG